jgi:hypothetical protein
MSDIKIPIHPGISKTPIKINIFLKNPLHIDLSCSNFRKIKKIFFKTYFTYIG